ncbi:hypothetical protein VE02_03072 [Pseudogymnoascus sp. 03VT05]|nr:hypothetical protein VE02_03072 [Pseudogymnoascus sp. 03VT05]
MRATIPLIATLSVLLPSITAIPTNTPIYLADIFHPPTLNLLAFLPGEIPCESAQKIKQDTPFSIGGIDGIVLKSYWTTQATLMRDGRVFADCHISPESVVVDACPVGRRERLTGLVKRTWSCWVVGDGKWGSMGEIPLGEEGGSGTKAGPNRPYWES